MCTTCVATASQAASWGPPAVPAGAAAVLTGVRTRFPGRARTPAPDAGAAPGHADPVATADGARPGS